MRSRGFWIAAAALLALGLLWLLTADRGAAPRPVATNAQTDASPGAQSSVGRDAAETAGALAADGTTRKVVEPDGGAATATDTSPAPAVFRGRTVDSDGVPIAGARATVRGWPANRQNLDIHVRDHGEVSWTNPETVTTGSDGRFEITFVPPPPYQFTLDIEADGFVGAKGRWFPIEPGVKDFGDIPLLPGARVRGRLVDADGRPVRPVEGRLTQVWIDRNNRPGRPQGEVVPARILWAELSPDGSFVMQEHASPGTWNLNVRGLLPRAAQQEVVIVAPETDVDVVVHRPETLLRVEGIVVDELGRPIPNVQFSTVGMPPAGQWIETTARDGRFAVVQRPHAVDPEAAFALQFERSGYRTTKRDGVHWGDREVRIVMPRVKALEVLVVRAAGKTPVEEYGLRVTSTGGSRSSTELQVIDGWSHSDGITRVTTLTSGGRKRIVVEPRKTTGLAFASEVVDVDLEAPPRVTIELPEAVEQRVRLRYPDGSPVAASEVELIDADGQTILAETNVTDFYSGRVGGFEVGLSLDKATTGEDGRCTVVGPSGTPLTIRCLGAHPPHLVHGVELSGEELVLDVRAGAQLTIRLDPPDVPASWRRAAERLATIHGEPVAGLLPTVHLRRRTDTGGESFPTGTLWGVPLDENGTAVLRGVPPGSWTVRCHWRVLVEPASAEMGSMTAPQPIEVEDDERDEIVVDVSAYRTGTIAGTLHLEGEAGPDVGLTFARELPASTPDGRPQTENHHVRLAEDGAFRCDLPVGSYAVYAGFRVPSLDRPLRVSVRALPDVTVEPGVESEVTLRASFTRTVFRFVDASGEPVRHLRLWAVGQNFHERPVIPRTDQDGRTTIVGSPRSYRLACRIRSLVDDDAYRKALQEALDAHGGDHSAADAAMAHTIVELGTVTLAEGGDGRVVEIRMPEAWAR